MLLACAKSRLAAQDAAADWQARFCASLADEVQKLEAKDEYVLAGEDGWLFFRPELRFLSVGKFWGADAVKVSRAPKQALADPLPAIVDFNEQLKKRGILLVLLPVPAKAAIYPDKVSLALPASHADPAPFLHQFYDELRAKGVDVLDLTTVFTQERDGELGAVYCKTDTHWSGAGCVLAAHAIRQELHPLSASLGTGKTYDAQWSETEIHGDLADLQKDAKTNPLTEKIRIRTVREKPSGAGVEPDPASPVLLMGDSHTLVFHDFRATNAGLLDQLAAEMGFAPDLIGTMGSGATQVRAQLYRRCLKDPSYLGKKKAVVWCCTSRDFTEASSGWGILPVAK